MIFLNYFPERNDILSKDNHTFPEPYGNTTPLSRTSTLIPLSFEQQTKIYLPLGLQFSGN